MSKVAEGVWAASLTPMNDDLSVNLEQLHAHVERLFGNGCNGVALLGTTGEANSLSLRERLHLIESLAECAYNPASIMIGTGCCAAQDTVALSRAALDAGYPNLLMLPPFFYKGVSEEGIIASYAQIIERIADDRANIFVYDIPPQTGLEISVDLLVRLREAFPDNIVGVKDSSGNWSDMKLTCERLPGFQTFAGSEKFLLPILRAGGSGCISATANVTGNLAASLYSLWQSAEADDLHAHVVAVREMLQAYPAVAALKTLLAIQTEQPSFRNLRPPLMPLSETRRGSLLAQIEELGFDLFASNQLASNPPG